MVYRTKRRFVELGLGAALSETLLPGAERKLTGKEEALLIATTLFHPPLGRSRWTLTPFADEFVKLTELEQLSCETVRRRLADMISTPGARTYSASQGRPRICRAHDDVLDLYAETPTRPVVCFDESPTQLIGDVRQPIPATPRRLERYDCEYKRNGTANMFVLLDEHRSWRKVKVTEPRAANDFAHCMRLVDVHHPEASASAWYSTICRPHTPAALYEALPGRGGAPHP